MTYDINGFYDFLSTKSKLNSEEIVERLKFLDHLRKARTKEPGVYSATNTIMIEKNCYAVDWCFFLEEINEGKMYRYGRDALSMVYDSIQEHFFGKVASKRVVGLHGTYNKVVYLAKINRIVETLKPYKFFDFQDGNCAQNCIVSIDKDGNVECFMFKDFVKSMFNCTIRDDVNLLIAL